MDYKKYFTFFIYFLTFLIGINFYLRNKENTDNVDSNLYQKLFEIGYFEEEFNPYKKAAFLDIHPTNYFSLPLREKDIKSINNKVLTLNKNGFRLNPYNSEDKNKKCILFLGSSAAFGIGSSSDRLTVPALINNKLGLGYNVYNLSMPSWKSRQELISLLNFVEHEKFDKCSTIDTISLSGTTDLAGLESLKKSSLFKELNLRKNLYSSPIYFPKLEKLTKLGSKSKNDLKFNLRMAYNNLIDILFGELIQFLNFKNNLEDKNNTNQSSIKEDFLNKEIVFGQLNSFLINQKSINIFTNNLGGKHLLVLQPNLKNIKKGEIIWAQKNKIFTELIAKENCLNILDMRYFFNEKQAKYTFKNKLISMSLNESIKENLFKKDDLNKHFFFDNDHLTDLGNEVLAGIIYEQYMQNSNQNKCNFGSTLK
tara:strand:- start:409 stop:1680 length:1272 start_codon:yes stop_codon:yes gene_type:complete